MNFVIKEHNRLGDRFKGINIVNDQISNWSKRIYKKFGTLTNDEAFSKPPTDLVSVFKAMDSVVESELTNISAMRADEGEGAIEYD